MKLLVHITRQYKTYVVVKAYILFCEKVFLNLFNLKVSICYKTDSLSLG